MCKYTSERKRLENIKKQIQNGTYKIDSKLIANKIIQQIKQTAHK
ncbi:flagellar biosynthesis anti-sigma factor FlgM [Clostridium oceanicum]|uniref:Anti-sigma-28 factor FlgM C-terminal domain-containing protein n=1 Tax=Clostridium oceanicum TaxID=1543 RepID=A0ABP3V583_9CLOT